VSLYVDGQSRGSLEVTTIPDAEAELTLAPAGGAGAALRIGAAPLDFEALIDDYGPGAMATVNGEILSATTKVTLREGQVSQVRLELKDATASNIRRLFGDTLRAKVGIQDSLLVFYAWHS
jgi:hypothetical protein